ncbi:MAG TPA: lysylphosphatidylglycerol synthase transmembrane domain-containing protein [Anaerolineae bacterium]|nr:lysylphosphatidylglycerol synthase transmembrane domain-containing protein [Anaerolineae bacterium]
MKDKLITTLKLLISLGLMAYLFYRFLSDPQDRQVLLTTLTTANYGYLLLALGLFVMAVLTNAIKWYILLRAQGIPVPLNALTHYTFVGFFFNNFLPANVGGDVMRGFGLARYTARSAEAAVSVIVDRIIGLMAFMFTAMVAALIAVNVVLADSTTSTALAENLAQVEFVAILGLMIITGGFAIMLSHRLRLLLGRIFALKLLKPLAPLYERISGAFGAYRYQYGALLGAFAVGVVTVLLTGLVDIAIVAGLHGEIAPIYIFLFNPIIAVALIVPISIGGLGTGSVLYVYFYGLVGVSATLAFALSLVKQAVVYIGSLPGGALWLRAKEQGGSRGAEERGRVMDRRVRVED